MRRDLRGPAMRSVAALRLGHDGTDRVFQPLPVGWGGVLYRRPFLPLLSSLGLTRGPNVPPRDARNEPPGIDAPATAKGLRIAPAWTFGSSPRATKKGPKDDKREGPGVTVRRNYPCRYRRARRRAAARPSRPRPNRASAPGSGTGAALTSAIQSPR